MSGCFAYVKSSALLVASDTISVNDLAPAGQKLLASFNKSRI
jgi:hypothetical protein